MLIGHQYHSIDETGRTFLPKMYRGDLGDVIMVTTYLDDCLYVCSMEGWEKLAQKLDELPDAEADDIKTLVFTNAAQLEVSKQGRVSLPPHLRKYVSLGKDIVTVGKRDHAEIWDVDKYGEKMMNLRKTGVMDKMKELNL